MVLQYVQYYFLAMKLTHRVVTNVLSLHQEVEHSLYVVLVLTTALVEQLYCYFGKCWTPTIDKFNCTLVFLDEVNLHWVWAVLHQHFHDCVDLE